MKYDFRNIPRRILQGNKSTAQPATICVLDTETTAETWSRPAWVRHHVRGVSPDDYDGKGPHDDSWQHHTLRLGIARLFRLEGNKVTRRHELRFTQASEFWEWLSAHSRPRSPTWLFAHNLLFDLRVVGFPELLEDNTFSELPPAAALTGKKYGREEKEKRRGYLILADPPTIVNQWHKAGWKLIALDTLNWYPCSLAKLGVAMGLKKLRLPAESASDDVWFKRCERDVEILERAVLSNFSWVKEHDLGRLRFTLAGQAMAAFRHRFMKRKVVSHGVLDVQQLERACYYGGRTEMFYKGRVDSRGSYARAVDENLPTELWSPPRGPVSHLDVRGYYGSLMATEHLPCELREACFPDEPVSVEEAGLDRTCAAYVELDTDQQFPLKTADLGTLFVRGRFWTALCGAELERALQTGSVVSVRAWSRYRVSNLFAPFVDWCDKARHAAERKGDTLAANRLKLFPSGLQGKFGEMEPAWVRDLETTAVQPWGQWSVYDFGRQAVRTFRAIAGRTEEHVGRTEKSTSFCAIPAFVAAAGRERLHKFRETAGRQHTLYVCTDGLYVTQTGDQRLDAAGYIGQGKIGLLQRQEQAASAEFIALNCYRHGRRRVQGGIKENAVKLSGGVYEQFKFSGAEDLIAHGPSGGVWCHTDEVAGPQYRRRGGLLESGWIEPWTISHADAQYWRAALYASGGGQGSAKISVASGASGSA